jgi:hypothetical protein
VKGIGAKNESFSAYLKDLKLSKFSDIWTINKNNRTQNAFCPLKFHKQAIFNAAKKTSPCFGKLIFTKISCLFYIISTQTIYIYQIFNDIGFMKLRAVSKLSTFF